MDLVEIGWTGKPHGLRGELKLRIDEFYEDDLLATESLLIGQPPLPYFVESIRAGGAVIVKLEGFDQREDILPLTGRPLFLLAEQVTAVAEPEGATPYDILIGFTIEAEGYPDLGPIEAIMDLPQHYLAQVQHDGQEVLIPLHEDLIATIDSERKVVAMKLPEGLLD